MADKHNNRGAGKPKQTPKSVTPTIEDNSKDSIEKHKEKIKETHANNQKCDTPQPFIVKIEQKKGWKRAEIISLVSILITCFIVYMTVRSFQKTSQAVAIADSTFESNRIKDIEAQKITEAQGRPIIQLGNFRIVNLGKGERTSLRGDILAIGQNPAMVLDMRIKSVFSKDTPVAALEKLGDGVQFKTMSAIAGANVIPVTLSGDVVPSIEYEDYTKGAKFIYVIGKIRFKGFTNEKIFLYDFIYKISGTPVYNMLGIKVKYIEEK